MIDAAALPTAQGRVIGLPFLAFVFAVACTALPVLAHLHLPLTDLPNHIARLHIAATNGAGPLAEYYSFQLAPVPNAAVDWLWYVLGYPVDPARFANLIMATYTINMILAPMVLARVVHGRWTLWSAAVGVLVFNGPFLWGFQNFVWSLPFGIYAFALWLMAEPRSTALRVLIFIPVAAALYLMHFFVFGLTAVLIFGREVQNWLEERENRRQGFMTLAILMLPFILPVLWLVVTLVNVPASPAGTKTMWGPWSYRMRMFTELFVAESTAEFRLFDHLSTLALLLVGWVATRLVAPRGPRLVVVPQLRGALIALALVALLSPRWLNGVALVDLRAPVLVLAVLIAGSQWSGLSARQAHALVIAFACLILARGVAFERFAAAHAADVNDMYAATESLPAGARVLPLRSPGWQFDYRLSHLQALLVPTREIFVPTLFQGVHMIKLHDKWADYAHPALFAIDMQLAFDPEYAVLAPIFARGWDHKFTHVLLMDRGPWPDEPQLNPIADQGRFALFEVTQPMTHMEEVK